MRRLRVRSPSAPLSSFQPDELTSLSNDSDPTKPPAGLRAPWLWILVTLIVMVGVGLAAFQLLRPSATQAPSEIANDPLLVEGRVVFLDRCAGCHGQSGKGDGPTAKNLPGPPVGDLSDDKWKHGDQPEQVVAVIRQGVKNTQMPAWNGLISNESVRAVAAYVYHLSGRDVPAALRAK